VQFDVRFLKEEALAAVTFDACELQRAGSGNDFLRHPSNASLDVTPCLDWNTLAFAATVILDYCATSMEAALVARSSTDAIVPQGSAWLTGPIGWKPGGVDHQRHVRSAA